MSQTSSGGITLRELPLPVRLVLTTFLMSVGLGYFWGMAQIHFKHSSGGEPLPGIKDLVGRFSGVPWPKIEKDESLAVVPAERPQIDPNAPKVPGVKIKSIIADRCAVCHGNGGEKDDVPLEKYVDLEKVFVKTSNYPKGQFHFVINGNRTKFNKDAMKQAFFEKSDDWKDQLKALGKETLEKQREAELKSVVDWIDAGAPEATYDADAFPLPDPVVGKIITPKYATPAPQLPKNAEKAVPKKVDPFKEAKSKQLSINSLTQSTHAHLLSFAMLWTLTGLVFAYSSYPTFVKCVLSPIVLIAQVADISCWWLARLEGVGPYFAMVIMGTGAIVGLGLGLQIVLSLFNMYSYKGKMVLFVIMLVGLVGFGLVATKVVIPQLEEEKKTAEARS
ncbi:hypothetical protein [Zavarzinella formosa]|uniref:hypothetical protein n=1 Tax=Zavarzinella formosa TaxID=360055 RepID=UPI0002F12BB0|nr:hypothetical protein [Zavarzinella formosa]